MLGAADLRLGIAAVHTDMAVVIADLAGIAAITVVAAVAGNRQIDADVVTELMGRRQPPGPASGPAAQLFPIAGAIATGIVATLAVTGTRRVSAAIAARRPRARIALGQPARTGADPTDRDLVARTCDRLGRRRGPPGRFGRPLKERAAHRRRAPEAKQSLEQRAAALTPGQRLGQRIETTIVHTPALIAEATGMRPAVEGVRIGL